MTPLKIAGWIIAAWVAVTLGIYTGLTIAQWQQADRMAAHQARCKTSAKFERFTAHDAYGNPACVERKISTGKVTIAQLIF